MKLLVSCDHVFDCLTRGPFPSGGPDDDAVQRHLDACHECRQLAEALRPAVALLHEALPADEAAALPSYAAADADEELCQRADGALAARIRQILDRQEVHPRHLGVQERWLHAVRFAAASVLLGALATLIAGVIWPGETSPRQQLAILPATMSGGHQPSAEGLLQLTSLKLPAVCFPSAAGGPMASEELPANAASGVVHQCCTRCHAAGKDGAVLTQRTIVALQQSCAACHEARS